MKIAITQSFLELWTWNFALNYILLERKKCNWLSEKISLNEILDEEKRKTEKRKERRKEGRTERSRAAVPELVSRSWSAGSGSGSGSGTNSGSPWNAAKWNIFSKDKIPDFCHIFKYIFIQLKFLNPLIAVICRTRNILQHSLLWFYVSPN